MTDLRPGSQPPEPDAAPAKIIFLAGAVAHWWGDMWDTPEHHEYMKWRNEVRIALIAGGYLTYAHFEAFKGTWNPRAQKINNAALAEADLMLIMTDESVPSPGTDEEKEIAEKHGVPVLYAPSSVGLARLLPLVAEALEAPREMCGAQDWYDDEGFVVVVGTCQKHKGHEGRWHSEWRDGRLWAEWGGPVEQAPDHLTVRS